MQTWLFVGSFIAFLLFFVLMCTIHGFHAAYKQKRSEEFVEERDSQVSPLVQMIAESSARNKALTLNHVELSV
jgi:hypothetical protein